MSDFAQERDNLIKINFLQFDSIVNKPLNELLDDDDGMGWDGSVLFMIYQKKQCHPGETVHLSQPTHGMLI